MDALKMVEYLSNKFLSNCLCEQWVREQATKCVCQTESGSLSQTSKAPFKRLKHSKRLKVHLKHSVTFNAFKTFKAFKAFKVL